MNHLRLYRFLETFDRHNFVSSTTLQREIGIQPAQVRKLANSAPQTFVSSSYGYKLAKFCTASEIEDSIRVLLSRSEKIMHRARSLQRYSLERNKVSRRNVVRAVVNM